MNDLTFGIVVFTPDVENSVTNLLEIEYPEDKVKFHIVSKTDKAEAKMIALDKLKHKFNHSTLTMNILEQERHQLETQAFGLVAKSNYFVMLENDQKIDPLFLRKIANSETKSPIYKDKSCTAISSQLAKKNYLEYADFKVMQDFLEKETPVCYLNEE
jgi:hypothetical protein